MAAARFVGTLLAVFALAASTDDRTGSLLVAAVAYLTLMVANRAVLVAVEAGMQRWERPQWTGWARSTDRLTAGARHAWAMSELPDEFKCTVTNWEYIYGLCREVADQVKAAEFEPDVVVALARGGWFAGRCLCDFLGLDDLTSLKMEHYVGTGVKADEPQVRYPMPEGSVAGKDVLVIDDIADTGGSIRRAHEYVTDRDLSSVRTATLQLLQTSEFEPEFVGERLEEWTWVVYPWNFIEDMIDLVEGVMTTADQGSFTREDVRHYLAAYHRIDRIEMEIAQPNRLDEVLAEMERRDVATRVDEDRWSLA